MMKDIQFTHLWVRDFGWEPTVYVSEDFDKIELLGENKVDGKVFIAVQSNGKKQILKGA